MKIAVGGMIGSGKSTLSKQLSEHLTTPLMEEFAADDSVFNTLLQWLYEGKPDVEMLLQVYFLHSHWKAQNEFGKDVIVDRHIIEHWLFAQVNLEKMPTILNFYNGVFHQYMNTVIQPDLYVILDLNWESFEERVMKRGRDQEIANFSHNIPYFKNLLENYTNKLIAQCVIYNIPYIVVNTNGRTEEEVLSITLKEILKLRMPEWII
jgi:deoxyadenosine/deoxycytidine kinase